MKLPDPLLSALEGTAGFERDLFLQVHESGKQITSIRLNPNKSNHDNSDKPASHSNFPIASKIPWTSHGFYLSERPSFTFDPLFHAGTYYVQEASSMFLEEALKQTTDLGRSLKVLDCCAAPGGKSTHLQSLISSDSLLVSNEVIRSRANVLKDNIIKWGCENAVVTNNDPKDIGTLEGYFDVIVADAPCSGSGLFRRDPEAIEEWSENNVQLCQQRQRRIIADIWPALKQDGILIYSTCSFSKEEDEDIIDWICKEFDAVNIPLQFNPEWGIVETTTLNGNTGYRFWPDKVEGEGFFIACFRKMNEVGETDTFVKQKPLAVSKKDMEIVQKWVQTETRHFVRHLDTVYAWPANLVDDFNFLLANTRVIYSGVLTGEIMRDKLIPHHALALSHVQSPTIPKTELSYEQAILYLQRKDLQIEAAQKGWQLVTYQNHALGWINALPGRINNYYPKELRILRESK